MDQLSHYEWQTALLQLIGFRSCRSNRQTPYQWRLDRISNRHDGQGGYSSTQSLFYWCSMLPLPYRQFVWHRDQAANDAHQQLVSNCAGLFCYFRQIFEAKEHPFARPSAHVRGRHFYLFAHATSPISRESLVRIAAIHRQMNKRPPRLPCLVDKSPQCRACRHWRA